LRHRAGTQLARARKPHQMDGNLHKAKSGDFAPGVFYNYFYWKCRIVIRKVMLLSFFLQIFFSSFYFLVTVQKILDARERECERFQKVSAHSRALSSLSTINFHCGTASCAQRARFQRGKNAVAS
jgi:hypothetical protein